MTDHGGLDLRVAGAGDRQPHGDHDRRGGDGRRSGQNGGPRGDNADEPAEGGTEPHEFTPALIKTGKF